MVRHCAPRLASAPAAEQSWKAVIQCSRLMAPAEVCNFEDTWLDLAWSRGGHEPVLACVLGQTSGGSAEGGNAMSVFLVRPCDSSQQLVRIECADLVAAQSVQSRAAQPRHAAATVDPPALHAAAGCLPPTPAMLVAGSSG